MSFNNTIQKATNEAKASTPTILSNRGGVDIRLQGSKDTVYVPSG